MPATVVPGERPRASGSMVVVSEGESGLGAAVKAGVGAGAETEIAEVGTGDGAEAEAETEVAGPGAEAAEGVADGAVFGSVAGWSGDAQAAQNRDEAGFDVRHFGQSNWIPLLCALTIAPMMP